MFPRLFAAKNLQQPTPKMTDHSGSCSSNFANSFPRQRSEASDHRVAGLILNKTTTRSKANSSKSESAAAEKDTKRRQKALEKHFVKAQKQAQANRPLPTPISVEASISREQEFPIMDPQEGHLNWSPEVNVESHAVPCMEDYVPHSDGDMAGVLPVRGIGIQGHHYAYSGRALL